MVSRFLVSAQPASSLAWMAVCLIASVLAAQTGSPAPDADLLDSKSASRMLVNEVKPEYPALAKLNYIQGAVRMQLRVTREGRVVEAHVVRGRAFSLRCGPPSSGAMDVQAGALGKSSCPVVSGRRRFRAGLNLTGPDQSTDER